MDPANVSAVLDWPVPDSRKQLQQFLGFASFYSCLIRNYSSVAAPLTALTSVKKPFLWSPEANAAFRTLKEQFTSTPIFQIPEPSLQFVVEVDASDIRVALCGSPTYLRCGGEGSGRHSCSAWTQLVPGKSTVQSTLANLRAELLEWGHSLCLA